MYVNKIYEIDSGRDLDWSLIQRKRRQVNITILNL